MISNHIGWKNASSCLLAPLTKSASFEIVQFKGPPYKLIYLTSQSHVCLDCLSMEFEPISTFSYQITEIFWLLIIFSVPCWHREVTQIPDTRRDDFFPLSIPQEQQSRFRNMSLCMFSKGAGIHKFHSSSHGDFLINLLLRMHMYNPVNFDGFKNLDTVFYQSVHNPLTL